LPEIFDVTDWTNQFWVHTGGTRAKKYLLNPENNKYYYFKVSQFKEGENERTGKDFKFEFWSEIIAYELGKMTGFNVLKYDIAIYDQIIGCISESMINTETEELVEGIKFLQAYDQTFTQNDRSRRSDYTFQLIEKSLDSLTIANFVPNILEIIVFDSIIGNGDRHQENWAIISKVSRTTKGLATLEKEGVGDVGSRLKKWAINKFIWDSKKNELKWLFRAMKIIIDTQKNFAPIYDSGSSLGRELSADKVTKLSNDPDALLAYILKGMSEIHWQGKKISHFDLIIELSYLYKPQINTIISRVISRFSESATSNIIDNIDNNVPDNFSEFKIPKERKTLILKLVTSRIEMLKAIQQIL
jgi:hypothetical protein